MAKVFAENEIDAVIHFAGYKAVGESVEKPLMYYENNLFSAINVLNVMEKYGCRRFIFSSSATVYGGDNPVPFTEDQKTGGCTNPYGQTKFMIEQILQDVVKGKTPENAAASEPGKTPADPNSGKMPKNAPDAASGNIPDKADPAMPWSVVILRYFNPIGCHSSHLLEEQPKGVPNNLFPYIVQVARGIRPQLNVFGNNYPTPDGTGVRDYIHIMDLASGHRAALDYALGHSGIEAVNLGTGRGTSVLELVRAYERANKVSVPYVIAPRRAGDIAECYADCSKAKSLLGWEAKYTPEDACR